MRTPPANLPRFQVTQFIGKVSELHKLARTGALSFNGYRTRNFGKDVKK